MQTGILLTAVVTTDAMVLLAAPDLPSHQRFLLLHALAEIQFLMFLTAFTSTRGQLQSLSQRHVMVKFRFPVFCILTVYSDYVGCPPGSLTVELLKTIKRAGLLLVTQNNLLDVCHLSRN